MENFRPTSMWTFDLYTSDLPSRIKDLVAVMHTFRVTMITMYNTLSDRRHLLNRVSCTFFSSHTSLDVISYNTRKNSIFQTIHFCARLTIIKRVYYLAWQVHDRFYTIRTRLVIFHNYLLYFKKMGGRIRFVSYGRKRVFSGILFFFSPSKT